MRDSVGTVEDLHASATKITGLDDFGDDAYLDGLRVLLESYTSEAGLTPMGNSVVRASLRGALVARLLAEAAWRQFPDHADVPIERPIFVTGLSRTGTTALHRLLTADPAHQGLELWLTDVPQPRPPRETWDDDPVYRQIKAGYDRHRAENPDFSGLHYTSADTVEECWRLLRQSMKSVSDECLAYVPGYSTWLAGQDWTDAYDRHRRLLQLIGRNEPEKRWVLKNPSHLFALDELLAVYPDALVVQTHRPPSTTLASTCSLSYAATNGWSTAFTPEVIGRTQLDMWARGLAKFSASRARHDPARFCDVDYEDFVADPVGTVEGIYRHFGLPLSDAARAEIRRVDAQSRSGARKPSHQYALSDFGLTPAQVDARFADVVGASPTI